MPSGAEFVLPDVLAPGLHLVLCGTAPSRASQAAQAYYARPGNRFWPTLHAVGLTPVLLVGSSRVDLQACKLEYSIVSPK